MRKMTSRTKSYGGDGYYKITECDGYYLIGIASDKANLFVTYEYDSACGSKQEVEEELRKYSFSEIRKRYYDQCVYCLCQEMLC